MQDNEADYDDKGNKKEKFSSHAAIMVVNADGSSYIQDNCSNNNGIKEKDIDGNIISWNGGTEATKYDSNGRNDPSSICGMFSRYDDWYFQKLE